MRKFLLTGSILSVMWAYPALRLANAQKSTTGDTMGGEKTVTGCLQKGDERDEFNLTTQDGTKYVLKGSNLSPHVGHTISATGTPEQETGKSEKKEAKEAAEGPHIKVDKVQMVSNSCR